MENVHSIAIKLEHILNLPYQSADIIQRNPFGYFKSSLDELYDKDPEKAKQIEQFDAMYGKYEDRPADEWEYSEFESFADRMIDILKY